MLERSTRWLVTCLEDYPHGGGTSLPREIDRNVPVAVERAAAKLLMPNTVRTVADILALPEWSAEQLRLVVALAACCRSED
jgi:hypothetical protein